MWAIIKTIKKGRYDYALVPDHPNATKSGYVLLHRVVVENILGRTLGKNEEVHHINKNTHDNSLKNLRLVTKEEHRALHAEERTRKYASCICPNCLKEFEIPENQLACHKGYKNNFCSPYCRGKFSSGRKSGILTDSQKAAAENNVLRIYEKRKQKHHGRDNGEARSGMLEQGVGHVPEHGMEGGS